MPEAKPSYGDNTLWHIESIDGRRSGRYLTTAECVAHFPRDRSGKFPIMRLAHQLGPFVGGP